MIDLPGRADRQRRLLRRIAGGDHEELVVVLGRSETLLRQQTLAD